MSMPISRAPVDDRPTTARTLCRPTPAARVAQAIGLPSPVDDQVRVGVGPEEEDLGAEAGDFGIWERDGMAGHRVEAGGQSGSSRSFATSE
jgi:hypothetical protein